MTDPFIGIDPRPPRSEGLNAQFYEHARDGRVHVQTCRPQGHVQHPPRYRCRTCGTADLTWSPIAGRGELWSWTTTHFPFDRRWTPALPYRTGVVELPEGVRIVAALATGLEPRTGLPVRLVTAARDDDPVLLYLTSDDAQEP